MSKPSIPVDELEWASSSITDPGSGEANKIVPTAAKQTNGWVSAEEPPFNYFNYWQNLVWQYMEWLTNDIALASRGSIESFVGTGLPIAGVGIPALAGLSNTSVAYIDDSNADLRYYTFNGSTWSQIGIDLNISGVSPLDIPSISAMYPNRVAYIDSGNKDLRVYDFDGTEWSQTGIDLFLPSIFLAKVCALSATEVALLTDASLTKYTFDGTEWSQTGISLAIPGMTGSLSITAFSGSRIAMFDNTNSDLRVYDFDGTEWSQTGNDLYLPGEGFVEISAVNKDTVMFLGSTTGIMILYRFDGTDWASSGAFLIGAGTGSSLAISPMSSGRVALLDSSKDLKAVAISWTHEKTLLESLF